MGEGEGREELGGVLGIEFEDISGMSQCTMGGRKGGGGGGVGEEEVGVICKEFRDINGIVPEVNGREGCLQGS